MKKLTHYTSIIHLPYNYKETETKNTNHLQQQQASQYKGITQLVKKKKKTPFFSNIFINLLPYIISIV